MGNRGLMTMAGLWEAWKPKEAEDGTLSCTIITTDANPLLGEVHDRMPVILGHEDWPKWLDEETATTDELKAMLKPFDASRMAIWPVDKKFGNVKNEGSNLAERVAA
jgi:putative SOS response-associated peptidase YedK